MNNVAASKRKILLVFLFVLLFLFFPVADLRGYPGEKWYDFRIVETFPHDPMAFTQGLFFHDGFLYEGTGLYGQSSLRRVALKTGRVELIRHLPANLFGEGIALSGNQIFQLTWKSKIGFIYDIADFKKLGTFTYEGEGWGLTYDGQHLIMSDGTDRLRFLDPKTLKVVRTLAVRTSTGPLNKINELEFVKGEILANIWFRDVIARISPKTGRVLGWIDLSRLRGYLGRASDAEVLNGIAYDAQGDRLFVTGKLWPKLFHIDIVPRDKKK